MKAIIALTVLLTASIATAADLNTVTIDGKTWDIRTVTGTYDQHKELLSEQPWFGHQDLARDFMAATYSLTFDGLQRDGIYFFDNLGSNHSAYFAYLDKVMPDGRTVDAGTAGMVSDYDGCSVDGPDNNSQGWPCEYWPKPGAGTSAGYNTGCYDRDSGQPLAADQYPCVWAVATPVADTPEPFSVLPASGNYAASDSFDIVVTGITASIDHITSIYDGQNINDVLAGCWVQKTDTSISCNGISWGGLGLGQHTFEVYLDLSNGEQHYESVTWTVY